MTNICYLCGQPISDEELSDDHVVPKQLIKRKQPKAKGFDYGGMLPSHAQCNNNFGPEVYCQKAISLIRVLHDENCFIKCQHRDDPNIEVMALNSDYLSDFSQQDLRFFKIIDIRNKDISEWSNLSFFTDKTKINPFKQPLFVSLGVLSKSAAALLVSRQLKYVPSQWHIVAIPYFGDIDFDQIFGPTKPFDTGVKIWISEISEGNWLAIYKAHDVLVFLFFWFSRIQRDLTDVLQNFRDAQPLLFSASRLVDLVDYQWRNI